MPAYSSCATAVATLGSTTVTFCSKKPSYHTYLNKFYRLLLLLCCIIALKPVIAQKVLPVTKSGLSGISLPEGSRQDKRLLMVGAAHAVLEIEAKKMGATIQNTEVLYLTVADGASYNLETFTSVAAQAGWQLAAVEGTKEYFWLQQNQRVLICFYSTQKKQVDIYLAEANGIIPTNNTAIPPAINSTVNNTNNPPLNDTTTSHKNAVPPIVNTVTEPVNNSVFQYNTTNFDDGWVSTIQTDWVLVTKGDIKVYVFYALPYNASDFSGTGIVYRDYYWDNYVSKYYTIETKQYKDNGEVMSSQKPPYVEGWAIDKQTGNRRFIGMRLDISPNTAYITIGSAKDEAALWQQFPKANGGAWSPSDLSNMGGYNKFAIAETDIIGTWQDGNTSTMQWYYTAASGNPGGYAGMTVAARSATFNFNEGGNYTSIHNGATGSVGAMNTFQQNYKGKYTVTNWNITATNRWDGKTESFNSWFRVIRGGRILCMDAGGMTYRLVKAK